MFDELKLKSPKPKHRQVILGAMLKSTKPKHHLGGTINPLKYVQIIIQV